MKFNYSNKHTQQTQHTPTMCCATYYNAGLLGFYVEEKKKGKKLKLSLEK